MLENKKFIPSLTGLRAICAYGIFFYHIEPFAGGANPVLHTVVSQFYSFIPFFFVISAFVIFHTYYTANGYTVREYYNYFINRFARIFPILVLLNTAVFFLLFRDGQLSITDAIKQYLLNISLLKGFSSELLLTGIGPSWTNSVEEIFYLLAPITFVYIHRKFFLAKGTLLVYAAGVLITFLFIRFPFSGFFSDYLFTAYFTFFGRVFEFACGIYLAALYKGIYQNKLLEKYKNATLPAGILLLILCYTLLFYIARYYQVAHANETWQGVVVNNFMFPVAIFLILYSLLYCKTLFQKFLSQPFMVTLGNSTYSFYLLHTTFVLSYIYKYVSRNPVIAFVCMVVVSYIFYKLIEQPAARLVKKWLRLKEK